jgi:hypothetical protein
MIVSASRRTDIPAFYSDWFFERVRQGTVRVANPFNPRQVRLVSLAPADVEAVVFWSKNPAPLARRLAELDRRGLRYAFLLTVNDYPPALEPALPPLADRLATVRAVAAGVGPDRVAWRYDPILLAPACTPARHRESFRRIAAALAGRTRRVIVSLLDPCRPARTRLAAAGLGGCVPSPDDPAVQELLGDLAAIARDHGLEIQSCAEPALPASLGIAPGKCLDEAWLQTAFGFRAPGAKDPGQRRACGCIRAVDIGARNTCPGGCLYCYATDSFELAGARHEAQGPSAPALAEVA